MQATRGIEILGAGNPNMIEAVVILYFSLTLWVQLRVYNRHCQKPRFRPLKEAGLLRKHTNTHLLHAMVRRKGDPLRRLQLELGLYGLIHMVVVIMIWLVGASIILYIGRD